MLHKNKTFYIFAKNVSKEINTDAITTRTNLAHCFSHFEKFIYYTNPFHFFHILIMHRLY